MDDSEIRTIRGVADRDVAAPLRLVDAASPRENYSLAALPTAKVGRLASSPEPISFGSGEGISDFGTALQHVYFPITAILLRQRSISI